ncbi:glycosyltransferase [bacterium]|nr:glycosyltransferase [bacterium]
MRAPAASIVVPLLRQDDAWLAQALDSALRQTVPAEVVVVTAPTTPASNRAVLDAFAREHPHLVVRQQRRAGFPAAINDGIGTARAPRIGLLLSDDWLEPTAVEETLRIDADIVSAGISTRAADGVTRLDRPGDVVTMDGFLARPTLERRAAYLQHFFLFSRASLVAVGGLDETLGDAPGIDDYDLVWTLLERGATVGIVGRSLYNYRDHERERLTLRDPAQQVRTLERILDKHGVGGDERQELIARHARWFGRPIHAVRGAGTPP